MKARTFFGGGWMILGLLLAGSSAFAQKEQWLEYRLDAEGYAYSYLDLTTNPPAAVALPKCSPQAVFALWKTPMDPAGRWICLDRVRKSGPFTRIYVDTAGNGRLDDKTPMDAKRFDTYSAFFEPVKMVFKGEDGPISYHLLLRSLKYDNDQPRLLMSPGGHYEGTVDMGGKKRHLSLMDGNVSGTFNDQGPELRDRDFVVVRGDTLERRYLGRMIEVDGDFYRISVARDGAYVKVQKAENVAFGQVKVPETISKLEVVGENGHFARKPIKGEFSLPAGRYCVVDWTIERKDTKGAFWTLSGSDFQKTSEFEVTSNQTVALAVGEPVRVVLKAYDETNEVRFNLEFRGPSDETVRFTKGGQNPLPPKLTLASADGVYHWTNSFEYG